MDGPSSARERLEADLRRTVDRLRTMGLTRLAASFEPEPTRADAARALASRLETASAALEGRPPRELPRLADSAVADQVAVCGHDLLAAAASEPDRPTAEAAMLRAADDLLDLRRRV